MKIHLLSVSVLLLLVWQVLSSSMRDPNNPPTGRTGAPGETTCGASGCHSGGNFTGVVEISGIPDTVAPNTVYSVTLTQTSTAVRGGFEATCLDSANIKCGAFTNGTGTSIGSAGGRQYIRQSAPKNLSNGSVSWTFSWKSPATIAGDSLTFYFVSLAANGNGQNSGDKVLSASKRVAFQQQVVGTDEPDASALVNMYPTTVHGVLNMNLLQNSSGQVALFDLQGKQVFRDDLKQYNRLDVSHLEPGLYIARIKVGNYVVTRKFLVQ